MSSGPLGLQLKCRFKCGNLIEVCLYYLATWNSSDDNNYQGGVQKDCGDGNDDHHDVAKITIFFFLLFDAHQQI